MHWANHGLASSVGLGQEATLVVDDSSSGGPGSSRGQGRAQGAVVPGGGGGLHMEGELLSNKDQLANILFVGFLHSENG